MHSAGTQLAEADKWNFTSCDKSGDAGAAFFQKTKICHYFHQSNKFRTIRFI
jgi:hypothetical protein